MRKALLHAALHEIEIARARSCDGDRHGLIQAHHARQPLPQRKTRLAEGVFRHAMALARPERDLVHFRKRHEFGRYGIRRHFERGAQDAVKTRRGFDAALRAAPAELAVRRVEHMAEIRRRDGQFAHTIETRDAKSDAVPERQSGHRMQIVHARLFHARGHGMGHQQRFVAEQDLGPPGRLKQACKIDLLRPEDRRPDEPRRCRIDQPLAADGNDQHIVVPDLRPFHQPFKRSNKGGRERLGRNIRMVARLLETVEQCAAVIGQRILHHV